MAKRDNQRSRVYAWEKEIDGYHRAPEFESVEACEAWARRVWRSERGRYGRARVPVPEFIRPHWGQQRALAHSSHKISLPRWARQRPVILHEMAHRLTPRDEAHGPRFVGVLIGLLCRHVGYDVDELLALADEHGVKYHINSVGSVPMISLSDKLERLLRKDGPLPRMWIAAELDVSYRKVQGAALHLVKTKRARWHRGRLIPTASTASAG